MKPTTAADKLRLQATKTINPAQKQKNNARAATAESKAVRAAGPGFLFKTVAAAKATAKAATDARKRAIKSINPVQKLRNNVTATTARSKAVRATGASIIPRNPNAPKPPPKNTRNDASTRPGSSSNPDPGWFMQGKDDGPVGALKREVDYAATPKKRRAK